MRRAQQESVGAPRPKRLHHVRYCRCWLGSLSWDILPKCFTAFIDVGMLRCEVLHFSWKLKLSTYLWKRQSLKISNSHFLLHIKTHFKIFTDFFSRLVALQLHIYLFQSGLLNVILKTFFFVCPYNNSILCNTYFRYKRKPLSRQCIKWVTYYTLSTAKNLIY